MVFAVMRSKSVQSALILSAILHAVSSYTTFTECGGELTQQAGVIKSPNFPQNYPGYAQCSWTITVAQDQVIDLSFQRLDLRRRRDQDCYDYLSVYDGPDQTSPFIENKLCGYQNDSEVADIRLRSTGNQMHLYFYAYSSESWPGFSASYWAHNACLPFTYGRDDCNTPCACNQTNTLYCNSVNGSCVCKEGWTSSLCTVDIDECRDPNSCPDVYSECMNTEGSFECSCKAGLIKNATGYCEAGSGVCKKGTKPEHTDGSNCIECDDWTFGYNCINNCACNQRNTESCDKVTGLCNCYLNWTGNDCRENVNECRSTNSVCNTTSSRCIDTTGSYECRCNAGYENVDGNHQSCQECGRVFTEPSGSIISWKYSETQDTEECSWTIRVDEGKVISLNVSKFTHGNSYPSFLEFYDGGNSSSRSIQRLYKYYYHTFSHGGIIRSSGNEMHIVLYTSHCGSNYNTEFMATYWSHECPKGMYGEKCEMQCVCNENTAYCNSTTGQCVCKEGWRSENCSVDIDECSEDPLACPDYSDCENLDGSHDCKCRDGLTNVNGLCKAPKSSGNLSCTDSSCLPLCVTTQPGAKQCYCPVGMVLNGGMCVECSSMTYGPDCSRTCSCVRDHTLSCDPRNGTCTCVTGWTGDMCEEDVNECKEDECGITPCTPRSYSTCHNTVGSYNCTCDYSYGYVKTGKDTCEQINCSYSYTDMYGNISSPNYPEDYFRYMDCSWSITVNPGFVISLRFSDFDVYAYNGYEYVEVHDGNSTNAPVIGHYTSDSIPRITRSRGNSMYIVLHSRGYSGHRGFAGTYVSHPTSVTTDWQTSNTTTTAPTTSVQRYYQCHVDSVDLAIPVSVVPNSKLHLKESSCQLQNNGTHHVLSFGYQECGTSVAYYTDYVYATNDITVESTLPPNGLVVFADDYTIPLECRFHHEQFVNGAFQAVAIDSTILGRRGGADAADFILREFRTELYQDVITEYPAQIPLNKELFVEIALANANGGTTGIVVKECKATPSNDDKDNNTYTLIQDGCPAQPTVQLQPNPHNEIFRFSLQAFHFADPINQNNMVYLHCDVSICPVTSCTSNCAATKRRRRRSIAQLVDTVTVSSGPYLLV